MEEGYIKFRQLWDRRSIPVSAPWRQLEAVRKRLYRRQLIGAYADGTGYGNISMRLNSHFLVTGSATGTLPDLQAQHYAVVTSCNLQKNQVSSYGLTAASSESMTHAVFYQLHPAINAVIHVHSLKLWQGLLHKVATTDVHIPYGTPEMAREIQRLWHQSSLQRHRIVAMAGHREGIFTFGSHLKEALEVLLQHMHETPSP